MMNVMKNNCGVALIVILTVLVCDGHSERCDFVLRVKQTLLNQGFHRNLTYGIVLDAAGERMSVGEDRRFSSCLVGVEQALPAGVFVNPDELQDLRRLGRMAAFPRSKVDVEQPAERASTSLVYAVGKVLRRQAALWLPLHARYHWPRQHGGMAVNIIPAPKLFMRCPDESLNLCQFRTPSELPFLCNGNSQDCDWKEISYTLLSEEVRWAVPTGALDHSAVVALATGIVAVLGSLYLLRVIHCYNRHSAKKNA